MARTRRLTAAAVAAALLGGGAIGFGIGAADSGAPAPSSAVVQESPQYLLLVHQTESVDRAVREQGMDAIVAEYAAWANELAAQGRLVDADKLAMNADWIGSGGPETSAISGFFVIRADSRAQALEIAERSPHARYGGIVEVRLIEAT